MNKFYKKFPSISALADYVDTDDESAARSGRGRGENASINIGDCNMSTDDARRRGREGGIYEEGAKNIEPIHLDGDQLNARDLALPMPTNAAAGYRANVPAYLCGSPYSMWRQEPQDRPNRLIKIAVQIGKSANVDQSETFNRGNAILSVLNALHELGFALELHAIWRNQRGGDQVSIETCIKQADQSYSPDSIAFALCNDGFQRRLVWRVAEMNRPTSPECKNLTDHGYGNGTKANYDDFDLAFGYQTPHRHWERKESALKVIIKDAAAQLDKMRVGA